MAHKLGNQSHLYRPVKVGKVLRRVLRRVLKRVLKEISQIPVPDKAHNEVS